MRLKKLVVRGLACGAAVLAGCATGPQAVPTASMLPGTVLLRLKVDDPGAPRHLPLNVSLHMMDAQTGERVEHVFTVAQPRHAFSRDLLMRLELPAGAHAITHVLARIGAPSDGLLLDAELHAPFRVTPGETAFLGHLRLATRQQPARAAGARPEFRLFASADATVGFESEATEWAGTWPDLRAGVVKAARFDAFDVLRTSLDNSTRKGDPQGAPAAPQLMALGVADARIAGKLAGPVREAYLQFLRLPHPRALAVAPNGAAGVASRQANVVDAAIAKCKRHARGGDSCVLFAVDDTLLVDPSRPGATAAGRPDPGRHRP